MNAPLIGYAHALDIPSGFAAERQQRMSDEQTPFEHQRVAALAYAYWEQRGRPQASSQVDWFRALAVLASANQNATLISAFDLEPNEGPWLAGGADEVIKPWRTVS